MQRASRNMAMTFRRRGGAPWQFPRHRKTRADATTADARRCRCSMRYATAKELALIYEDSFSPRAWLLAGSQPSAQPPPRACRLANFVFSAPPPPRWSRSGAAARGGRARGLHWTTDRTVAEGFAQGKRCIKPNPTLVHAEIPKQHIFAVLVDRQEHEIVLDLPRLRKLGRS